MGIDFSDVELRPKGLTCSYCDDVMYFTSERVKRPVPPGAKDLNIYDERKGWQCSECNHTATDFITSCRACGSDVLDFEDRKSDSYTDRSERLLAPQYPSGQPQIFGYLRDEGDFKDPKYPEQCLHCVTCKECGKNIYDDKLEKQIFSRMMAIENTHYTCFYYHKDCVQRASLYKTHQKDLDRNRREFKRSVFFNRLRPFIIGGIIIGGVALIFTQCGAVLNYLKRNTRGQIEQPVRTSQQPEPPARRNPRNSKSSEQPRQRQKNEPQPSSK